MKVLISPVSLDEAKAVIDGGADIIDVKNTNEGSLGAQFPWVIQAIAELANQTGLLVSATLGDLPFKPGTAALAARGAATAGARYKKAGLYGVRSQAEAAEMMSAVVQAARDVDPRTLVVAAGYADFRRFGGLHFEDLIAAASQSGCDLVMVDTAIKDGKTLFDALSLAEITDFFAMARRAGLQVALAGSIQAKHLPVLQALGPDIVGIRGAVCDESDRTRGIKAELVRAFTEAACGRISP